MMVQCKDTGVWYDPELMLEVILTQNAEVMVRLKYR